MISKSGLFNLQSSNSSFVCPLQNGPCWEHSTYFFTNLCIIVCSVQRLLWNLSTKFSSSVAPQVILSFSRLCRRLKNDGFLSLSVLLGLSDSTTISCFCRVLRYRRETEARWNVNVESLEIQWNPFRERVRNARRALWKSECWKHRLFSVLLSVVLSYSNNSFFFSLLLLLLF